MQIDSLFTWTTGQTKDDFNLVLTFFWQNLFTFLENDFGHGQNLVKINESFVEPLKKFHCFNKKLFILLWK